MKAAVLIANKEPLVIQEWALPKLEQDEVLVQLKAAALNHRDVWIQKGLYAGITYPIILGSDGAGVVVQSASKENKHLEGKEIIINPSHDWGDNPRVQGRNYHILGLPQHGTFAEYVKVKAQYIVEKPAHLSFEEAAALPLAGLTAYRTLFTRAATTKQDQVLISGVGGGVALFACQFAIACGASVYVTSSSQQKIEAAQRLGAKGGANYKEEKWAKAFKKQVGAFDVIIDSACGSGFNTLIGLANMGGRIAFYGATRGLVPNLKVHQIFWKQLSILGSTMGHSVEFAEMVAFVGEHEIKPVVDSCFSLNDIQKAMDYMDAGKQFGKIVIQF